MRELARHAECAPRTVLRFENGDTERMQSRTITHIRRTLEDAGVEFFGEPAAHGSGVSRVEFVDGSGVRLRAQAR